MSDFYCSPCQRSTPCVECTGKPGTETEYVVYAWDAEAMEFTRRIFIRHEIGQQLSDMDVLTAINRDIEHFKPGKYRAVPASRWVDFEVTAEARLS